MSENDEIRAIFLEEAQDIIQRILDDLNGFLAATDKNERFNAILRGIHTIKGGAASCGLMQLKDEAHTLESSLQAFKGKSESLGSDQVQLILRTLDQFDNLLTEPETSTQTVQTPDSGFAIFDESPAETPAPANDEPSAKEEGSAKTKASSEVIRIPLERIQRNFDTISEIFLTRNQLRHLVEQKKSGYVNEEVFFRDWEILDNQLRQNIRDLEHNAMAMRLTSVKSLLRRMEKTVRSFSKEAEKNINVEILGEDIEIDKLIVDSLAEPLIHLVRNAMDHGVESQAERTSKKKKSAATIRIEVATSGNEALIKVSDDGRGIDAQKVLASATKKGLDVSSVKTRDDMLNLIFMPGFSTKEAISDVSGRGIGMDAVKTYVENLGGSITINTEVNAGTTFSMRLPLGLSVVPAIIALVNGRRVAIVTADILEIFKVPRDQIIDNDGKKFYNRKNKFIRCIDLEDHLFYDQKPKRYLGRSQMVSLCICETSQELVAMQVEALLSNVEIALKEPPTKAASISYTTGVSILATGEAVFVVSLSKLYEKIKLEERRNNKNRVNNHAAA